MAKFLTLDASGLRNIVNRASQARTILASPFGSGRGREVVKIMRTGARGVSEQFRDSTEYRGKTATPWARSHAFGDRPAPRKTMVGSGIYRSAFLGGAGSIERIKKDAVEIGVDSSLFPQVKIHQGRRASVTVKPKARTKNGSFKMRYALGFKFGAWFSNARLAKGFKIARRRVSVSSDVRKAAAKLIKAAVGKGFKAPRLSTSAQR